MKRAVKNYLLVGLPLRESNLQVYINMIY